MYKTPSKIIFRFSLIFVLWKWPKQHQSNQFLPWKENQCLAVRFTVVDLFGRFLCLLFTLSSPITKYKLWVFHLYCWCAVSSCAGTHNACSHVCIRLLCERILSLVQYNAPALCAHTLRSSYVFFFLLWFSLSLSLFQHTFFLLISTSSIVMAFI